MSCAVSCEICCWEEGSDSWRTDPFELDRESLSIFLDEKVQRTMQYGIKRKAQTKSALDMTMSDFWVLEIESEFNAQTKQATKRTASAMKVMKLTLALFFLFIITSSINMINAAAEVAKSGM